MDIRNKSNPVSLFSICYEPKHTENKPPIIFIHGILSTPYCWNKVKNKICDKTGRKGYAVCLRNHGSSDWSEEMSVTLMASDVKNFMLKENISKAVLIAHSLGGRVALAVALQNPDMIEKIIIDDMKLTVDDNEREILGFKTILELATNYLKELSSSVSENVAQKKIQHLFTFAWSKKPDEKAYSRPLTPHLPFYKNKSSKFEWEINIKAVTKMFGKMQEFKIPLKEDTIYLGEALFIAAEYSAFEVLKQKELIQKHLPKSQFFCAKGIYHSCHLEKPEEFVKIITKFLVPNHVSS